jgi:hypothetical protein
MPLYRFIQIMAFSRNFRIAVSRKLGEGAEAVYFNYPRTIYKTTEFLLIIFGGRDSYSINSGWPR